MIDFQSSFETTSGARDGRLQVKTSGNPVYLNFDGNQRIGVNIGNAEVSLFSFIHARGSFIFEKGPTHTVMVDTGIPASLGGLSDRSDSTVLQVISRQSAELP